MAYIQTTMYVDTQFFDIFVFHATHLQICVQQRAGVCAYFHFFTHQLTFGVINFTFLPLIDLHLFFAISYIYCMYI